MAEHSKPSTTAIPAGLLRLLVPGREQVQHNSTTHGTQTADASVQFSFNGTFVSVFGTLGTTESSATFTVDGGQPVTKTTPKPSTPQYDYPLYFSPQSYPASTRSRSPRPKTETFSGLTICSTLGRPGILDRDPHARSATFCGKPATRDVCQCLRGSSWALLAGPVRSRRTSISSWKTCRSSRNRCRRATRYASSHLGGPRAGCQGRRPHVELDEHVVGADVVTQSSAMFTSVILLSPVLSSVSEDAEDAAAQAC
ncbi:hypothetical protein A0H81_12221 [Grifola frondosa]|uniref:Uncharacterized protein n=1 Tax=Grifola frondosa TaxID=5627 RepID=A0A1C7LUQ3_GRIFR|nr:hypothetical protein A0H81_12221 [Grifola frondosa]